MYRITGGYADRVVVGASTAVPKPPNISFEEAAGLFLTGATAFHTLAATGVREEDTVLIHGASGGVGQMAVQLAMARGARVIGTASAARHDVVRALGGEPVAYGDGLADRIRTLARSRRMVSTRRSTPSAPMRRSTCRSSWSPIAAASRPSPASVAVATRGSNCSAADQVPTPATAFAAPRGSTSWTLSLPASSRCRWPLRIRSVRSSNPSRPSSPGTPRARSSSFPDRPPADGSVGRDRHTEVPAAVPIDATVNKSAIGRCYRSSRSSDLCSAVILRGNRDCGSRDRVQRRTPGLL